MIFAFDLSLSNTGVAVFHSDSANIFLGNFKTSPKNEIQVRLKNIADFVLDLRKKYRCEQVVIERGFYRYNKASEALNKVHGVVNYLFYDCPQIYYAPSTIKKEIISGKASKEKIKEKLVEWYPEIVFENDNESDAFAVGICYFLKNGILEKR